MPGRAAADRLRAIGFDEHFEAAFAGLERADLVPARVARATRRVCSIWDGAEELEAVIPKKLFHAAASPPVVGDWVAIEPGERPRVAALLERKGALRRRAAGRGGGAQVIAANVDAVFLVSGLDGDFNLRRIERYLALAWQSRAEPVIILNKADLAPDPEAAAGDVRAIAGGAPVLVVSAKHGAGLDALGAHLVPGRTIVVVGSSGVGKSTLVNRLVGAERMRTAEVRAHDDRGRHTTSQGELIVISGGALLIDTPGLRELGLYAEDDGGAGLAEAFSDVEGLGAACRFNDCRHETEPGCAVRAAVAAGELPRARLESYKKLRAELERQRRSR